MAWLKTSTATFGSPEITPRDRQTRPQNWRRHRISNARFASARSAYADVRSGRDHLVHSPAGQHGRRLDSKTGKIKLVKSPTPKLRPSGIKVNPKGVPIFVEFGTSKVAMIDPKTMAVHEYALPDAAARPRRLALTGDSVVCHADFVRGISGVLTFHREASRSGRRQVGRSPSTTAWSPSMASSGTTSRAPSRLRSCASIPKTEKFQSWAIPGGSDIARSMSVTSDGNPVIADSLVNAVGLIEVRSPTSN
jgi:virginiamycin B lyase